MSISSIFSPFYCFLVLFISLLSGNIEAKVLSEKNIMVKVDVTVPDTWNAVIKSVGDDFIIYAYFDDDEKKKPYDISASLKVRNNFVLKTPKIVPKVLTPLEIKKGGLTNVSHYKVMRDENPGSGLIYISYLSIDIIPDYNRDGKIDDLDRDKVTKVNPWRWWINDDDDKTVDLRGNNLNDLPHQSIVDMDANDLRVDGMRDLIDFYPLHIDIAEVLAVFPSSDYRYVLKHDDEALQFFEYATAVIDGSVARHSVDIYLKDTSAGFSARAQELKLVSKGGVDLSENYLATIGKGVGTIVVEGSKRTKNPLILEIVNKKDKTSIARIEFPLTIVNVEDMFRRVNLRDLTGGGAVKLTQKFEPREGCN